MVVLYIKVYQYYLQLQVDDFFPDNFARFIVDTAVGETLRRDGQKWAEMVIEEDNVDGYYLWSDLTNPIANPLWIPAEEREVLQVSEHNLAPKSSARLGGAIIACLISVHLINSHSIPLDLPHRNYGMRAENIKVCVMISERFLLRLSKKYYQPLVLLQEISNIENS